MQNAVSTNRIGARVTNALSEHPVGSISLTAARLSLGGAVGFLVLLAVLHVVKTDYDPSWRFISEYAIGDYGWLMIVAFMSLAVSCSALVATIKSQVNTIGGKLGLGLLLLVAASLTVAGIFVADPITATPDQLTIHGTIHGLAATIGIPGLPVAAVLISRSLVHNPAWYAARRWLLWTAHFTWISVLLMFVSLFVLLGQTQGKFGPDVLIGWPNRLVVVSYCAWLIAVGRRAIWLSRLDL